MAEHLAAHGELALSPQLRQQLSQVRIVTVRRITACLQQYQPRHLD